VEADHPRSTSDYQEKFLRLLNNRAKSEGPKTQARTRGFVVIARGATSLTSLQSLCIDEQRQKYNPNCLTARYRLQPSAALGTLLMAFFSDLVKIEHGEKGIAGDLRPNSLQEKWKLLARRFLNYPTLSEDLPLWSLVEAKHGTLDDVQRKMFFEALKSESKIGDRLVLFGEIAEEGALANDWQAATEVLFTQLPERVGLVFSGAPKDFVIPRDDSHFLEITLPATDSAAAEEQAPASYKFTDSSFHTDEPASIDELGVEDYANAIAGFIVHPQTKAPLTLGINGPWGKGKSSFMNLVDTALIKYASVNRSTVRPELGNITRLQHWNDLVTKLSSADSSSKAGHSKEQLQEELEELQKTKQIKDDLWTLMEKEAKENIIGVLFNAWQFEDAKQTWAGLASQISETIEQSLPWMARQRLKLGYAWKERRSELILTLLLPLAIFFIVWGLVAAGFFAKLEIKPEGFGQLLPVGSTLLAFWFVSSQVLKVAVPISERVLSYTRMPNYREQMGFQHRVRGDLDFIRTFLTKRRPGCRVVVYIDDLDRCSEDKIMELLQAINLILGRSKFFVIVGMDTEMIHRAIKSHYKETPTERSPEDYLRKIVQISFFLPDTVWQARANYVKTLFSLDARLALATPRNGKAGGSRPEQPALASPPPGLAYNLEDVLGIIPPAVPKEAEDTAYELQAFRDYNDHLDDNPREIKRLINVHRLIKILLRQKWPNTVWLGERQRKLVKWLIFCERWPHLVDDILAQTKKPEFVGPLPQKEELELDILGVLAQDLAEKEKNRKGTDPPARVDGLKEFAEQPAEGVQPGPDAKPATLLLSKDIDEEFRSAASLSQLISKPTTNEKTQEAESAVESNKSATGGAAPKS
jgi:hypothetical protein